jgi:phytoene/squalene synthetase
MTALKPPRKRPYHRHGLTALEGALRRVEDGQDWTEQLGPVGEALRTWRADLVAALGGEDVVSPQQRALVELATRTHLMVESVDRFVLGMPSLVNKSRRSIFAVVKERQQLADALARYMGQLGLERRAKPQPSLSEYLAQREGEKQ